MSDPATTAPTHGDLLSPDHAVQVVTAGLGHLTRLLRKNGRFIYAHEAGHPDRAYDGYNLLRHCGTLWFMLRAVNDLDLPPDARLCQAMADGISYAGDRLEAPAWTPEPSLGLVTKGAVKLGGVGLALVMLGEYRRFAARIPMVGTRLPLPLDATIAALQSYALAQIEGEDFLHKRDFASGAVLSFRSDYYTGEAILGLLTTGCAAPALARVTTALMARGYGWAEQSHWMAYAACEALERGLTDPIPTVTYLRSLAEAILTVPDYRARRASTPIACRSEALTRLLLTADRRPGLFETGLLERARVHVRENLCLQLNWYEDGQFWKGDDDRKVQIDYIQHNATAFLNWHMHLQPAAPRRSD